MFFGDSARSFVTGDLRPSIESNGKVIRVGFLRKLRRKRTGNKSLLE